MMPGSSNNRNHDYNRSDSPGSSARPFQNRSSGPPAFGPSSSSSNPYHPQRYGFFAGNNQPQQQLAPFQSNNAPSNMSRPRGPNEADGLTQERSPYGPAFAQRLVETTGYPQMRGSDNPQQPAPVDRDAFPLRASDNENELIVRLIYTYLEKIRDPHKLLRVRNELLSRVQEVLEEEINEEKRESSDPSRKRRADTEWPTHEQSRLQPPTGQANPQYVHPSIYGIDPGPFERRPGASPPFHQNHHFLT